MESPAREADLRIQEAVRVLAQTPVGKSALRDLKVIMDGPARNLSLGEMAALVVLLKAFAIGGKRDFIRLEDFSGSKPHPHVVAYNSEWCSCGSDTCICQVCARTFCGSQTEWMDPIPGKTFAGNVCFQCHERVGK